MFLAREKAMQRRQFIPHGAISAAQSLFALIDLAVVIFRPSLRTLQQVRQHTRHGQARGGSCRSGFRSDFQDLGNRNDEFSQDLLMNPPNVRVEQRTGLRRYVDPPRASRTPPAEGIMTMMAFRVPLLRRGGPAADRGGFAQHGSQPVI